MSRFLKMTIASVQQIPESEQEGIAALIFQELKNQKAVAWEDFDQII